MTIPSTNLLYPKSEEFLSSGTWTRPSSQIEWVDILLIGGGGGGGGGAAGTAGGGGGGGEIKWRRMRVTGDITVTIGAAVTGGAADNDGNDGAASTLAGGCVLSVGGGDKGLKGTGGGHGLGGNGGGLHYRTPVNGDITLDGTIYYWVVTGDNGCSPGGTGGKSNISAGSRYMASGVPGYSNPGTTASAAGGGGGGSYGDGGNGNANAAGDAAGANTGGGGGGGGSTSKAGGNGGKGRCIIFWLEQ